MELTSRLITIAKLVSKNSSVADIGTDHGLLPNYLIENKLASKVICTDISKNSLNKSIELTKFRKNEDYIQCRVGNGLDPIGKEEVDTIIIAGMGGILISEIINKGMDKLDNKKLILQPMQAPEKLRKYLYKNKFQIIDEKLAKEDKRIYEIIVAEKVEVDNNGELDFEIPRILIENKDPLLKEFLLSKIKLNESVILKILKGNNSNKGQERINLLKHKNSEYEELINEL